MGKHSLLTALASEMAALADELSPLAAPVGAGDEQAVTAILSLLERLSGVGELLELPVLAELVNHFIVNLPEQIGQPPRAAVIELWPRRLVELLNHPDDPAAIESFAAQLSDPRWPQPMARDQADRAIADLLECDIAIDGGARTAREFTIADIDLALDEDLTIEMRTAFEHEAPLFAASLSREVANMDGRDPSEALRQARRVAHTLKGSAALVGARGVVNLTHLLEELLEILQERVDALNPELIGELQNAGDTLEEMVETVLGHAAPPDTILEVLRGIDQWIVQLGESADALEARQQCADPAVPMIDHPGPPPADDSRPAAPLAGGPAVSARPPEAPAENVVPEPSLNVPVRVIDEMLRSMSEMLVHFSHIQAALRSSTERSDFMHKHLSALQGSVHEIETMVDMRGTPFMHAGSRSRNAASGQHASDDPDGFDPLELDQYNQLHSLSRRFAESALDAREMAHGLHEHLGALGNRALHQQRLAQELNNAILAARMVRVSSQSNRWQRVVRQASRATGKAAELEIHGADLAIDTDILNALVEPLLHLLRNAVDHGIEAAEDRASAGKPAAGRLALAFRQDGSRIVVELSDDGAGLDEIAIARRAAELGLFPNNQPPGPNELHRTIFASGFSTRGEVSQLSGRGIGLDAVRAAIQRLGGTIDLSSQPGRGVEIRMILPHSLTSRHLLFVQIADARFALPSLGVSQVLFSDAGRLEKIAGRWIFSFDEQDYPMVRLADLLSMPGQATLDSLAEPRPLVLVQSGSGQLALLVDSVIESRESVVKSINDHLPGLSGVAGACVLGDGDLALVIDLARLQRQADTGIGEMERRIMRKTAVAASGVSLAPASVLIVDDSLSARRSLSRLVSDLGYRTETAFDGFDALEKIEADMPAALLLDLEMPRMNGLELTAHLRANRKTADLPIIMITSRSTTKHKQEADRVGVTHYLTKPYQEARLEELIKGVVIDRRESLSA